MYLDEQEVHVVGPLVGDMLGLRVAIWEIVCRKNWRQWLIFADVGDDFVFLFIADRTGHLGLANAWYSSWDLFCGKRRVCINSRHIVC